MNADSRGTDFGTLARQVTDVDSWWGADNFSVWAGSCPEYQLLAFLQAWGIPGVDIPYTVLEYMDRVVFLKENAGLDAERMRELERARVFGNKGDLSFVRDEEGWRWHFVGLLESPPPQGFGSQESLWTGEPGATFLKREEKAMLWGARTENQPRWFDSRVAGARLEYPVKMPKITGDAECRVLLNYRTFSRGRGVEFVWYLGLEPAPPKGESDG